MSDTEDDLTLTDQQKAEILMGLDRKNLAQLHELMVRLSLAIPAGRCRKADLCQLIRNFVMREGASMDTEHPRAFLVTVYSDSQTQYHLTDVS